LLFGSPILSPLPYPEWRVEVTRQAKRAGLGDIGAAIGFVVLGEHDSPNCKFSRRRTKASSRKAKLTSEAITVDDIEDEQAFGPLETDTEEDSTSDGSFASELEWEGWDLDLARQARLREHSALSLQSVSRESTRKTRIIRRRLMRRDLSPSTLSRPSSAESLSHRRGDATMSPFGNPPAAASIPRSPYMHSAHERERPYSPLSLDGTGASFEALSAMSPALLTVPSIMPLPTIGTTTSVVSTGGIIRAHSLTAVNEDGRGRGVPRAMGVLREGEVSGTQFKRVVRKGKGHKDERFPVFGVASSPPESYVSAMVAPDNDGHAPKLITSAREKQVKSHEKWNTQASNSAAAVVTASRSLTPSAPEGVAGEERRAERRGSRLMKGLSNVTRSKPFSPERLVKGLDSALNFVEGK